MTTVKHPSKEAKVAVAEKRNNATFGCLVPILVAAAMAVLLMIY